MKDYSDLKSFTEKKLRTLRNNLNNRIESFENGGEKKLPPSHMLSGLELSDCRKLLDLVYDEMRRRSK